MIWEEVLVDRNFSTDEIVDILSKLFSVPSAYVLVVDDIAEAKVSQHVRILCERMPVKGDFLMRLSIYLHDPDLEQLDSQQVFGQFCDILHCKCLMSDDSLNPFSWLLVQGSLNIQPVSLDPEQLDEEKYVIDTRR